MISEDNQFKFVRFVLLADLLIFFYAFTVDVQYTIACEVDALKVISAMNIAFIMSNSKYA